MRNASEQIVVGLTTVRSRLPATVAVIQALLAQTLPPSEIRLHLSSEPFAFDDGVAESDLPADLRRWRDAGRIRIVWTENLGPYRKIIPLLREFRGRDVLLATADDDVLYPPDWLASLVTAARRFPDAVVAHRAREARLRGGRRARYQSWPVAGRLSPRASMLLFPTGTGGVLYRPRLFDDRVLDAEAFRRLCPLSDDVWLRAATLARGVPVVRARAGRGEFPPVATASPRLWDATLVSDVTDVALSRALAHFGLAASAFAPREEERRRARLPLARAAGDPAAGHRWPVGAAVAWIAALAGRLIRRPAPDEQIAFSIAAGDPGDVASCRTSILQHYPDARVWTEASPAPGEGGRHAADVLRRFQDEAGAAVLVRLLPSARLWRRFAFIPAAGCFGVAGGRGLRRWAVDGALSNGVCDDPAYADASRWAPDPVTRSRAQTRERFLNEPDVSLILADMMRRVGAGTASWSEIRAGDVWPRGNFLRAWAVTRPAA